ncbi:MAG TPA: aspartate-semialdehyde dehydrogenase [Microvirga sp.]|nr:aspartate-semialdehyde dehydrogenase [Microvirga sp.]
MSFQVAVGGATGNVGSEMLRILEQRAFPVDRLVPLASAASAGRQVAFRGEALEVRDLATFDFGGIDLLFLSTGGENAKVIAPRAAAAGCVVIDNSSAFRMDPDVPLVVPEVNPQDLDQWSGRRILPVANCSTIQLVVALKPLHDAAGLRRVVVSTYQSAAGGGRRVLDRLMSQADPVDLNMRALRAEAQRTLEAGGEKPVAFNVVPHIDVFLEDGRTKEEWKMEAESRRILGLPDLPVAATCVRVPVFVGHAEAVFVELERPLGARDARRLLADAPGVRVLDEHRAGGYATPLDAAGTDPVWVSRIREDRTVPHGLHLWIVADNVRKGAALNAVQIAEVLASRTGLPPRPSLPSSA